MIVHKMASAKAGGDLEFVLSDDTLDRYGDRIDARGWELGNFLANPIALFGHSGSFPIGKWENVRVEGKRLIGRLKLAAKGTSARIDEIISLIEQDVLRTVSVGFLPLAKEPLPEGGYYYRRQELTETSVVSVPANPAAVAVAKSMHISAETMAMVFGESAEGTVVRDLRGNRGEQAGTSAKRNTPMNPTLSERIVGAQEDLARIKGQLDELIADENADTDAIAGMTGEIEQRQARIDALQRAEKTIQRSALPGSADDGQSVTKVATEARRPFAVPAQKVAPRDYLLRAAAVKLVSHIRKEQPDAVRERMYGNDEQTKAVFDYVQRAATAPATTTQSGWASQLVQTVYADFMETLLPASIYPALANRGLRLNFGRAGVISVPSRSLTPTVAGSFVGEGAPIPVRQAGFSSIPITPKKMAVISTFSREIATHSTPAIEGLLRDAIQEDTSVSLDTVLLDANAATTIRPAGLRNGVTVVTATAGGGFDALVADIVGLIGGLITATNGNVRAPVWIMNPIQSVRISLTQNTAGDFPFAAEIAQGNLRGYPIAESATVPAGMVILVDAADFVSVEGDEPMFEVSDQATLHMEDTAPTHIGVAGTPNAVAAPVRSMFQTDSIALRMIMPINWTLRRAGTVAFTESVSW